MALKEKPKTPSLKTKFKWIEFHFVTYKGVTSQWNLKHHDGTFLGEVYWYTQWRQYCFYPDYDTVFSKGCLEDINTFMVELRKNELLKRKAKNDQKKHSDAEEVGG